MTSTVLDVTVLLLCVSASVIALGAADGDRGVAGPEAAGVADLIATETVTVTYASAEAPNGARTIHATRAELLALVAAGGDGEEHAPRAVFESEALSAIEGGLGPRTRIDAKVETRASDEIDDDAEDETGIPSLSTTVGKSRWVPNTSAAPTTGTGVPWRIDRVESGDGNSESKGPAIESKSSDPIAIGSEPPRGADVTVAVITHPVPNAADSTGPVRIVIRRW